MVQGVGVIAWHGMAWHEGEAEVIYLAFGSGVMRMEMFGSACAGSHLDAP